MVAKSPGVSVAITNQEIIYYIFLGELCSFCDRNFFSKYNLIYLIFKFSREIRQLFWKLFFQNLCTEEDVERRKYFGDLLLLIVLGLIASSRKIEEN